jgi:nucleoside-diphosphate-sugar epimerase
MRQKLTAVNKASTWGWKSKTTLREGIEKTYHYYLSLNED